LSVEVAHQPTDRDPLPRVRGILFGGDYNPEQWPEEVWTEDADLMRQAGVNVVSLGIFAWARMQPRAETFDFDWLDRVIDLLASRGVSVDLATPTASPPPWLIRRHPDILPATIDGQRLWHGSRRHYCPHSTAYRAAAAAVVRAEADHYRDHPSVVAWHVDNEYACHFGECFCDASATAFRDWLLARYESLDGLNAAWATAFWSQTYTDWVEVHPPRRAPTFVNPGQRLDWARFCSDSWLACFDEQVAILKAATPDIPVTTNFMGFHKTVDYWKWAAHEDVVANDAYPDTSAVDWMVDAAMGCDLMRSLGRGRPWMLMEQAAAHVNWRPRNATKRPGVMRLGSYQAIARGADATMFFQWRASKAGAEKFHSAMLPHSGVSSRTWQEVSALGAELRTLADVRGSRVRTPIAIAFDWANWWAFELDGKPSNELRLLPPVRAMYAALYELGLTVDFVHPEGDLSGYRLIVAPNLYLDSDAAAQNLNAWVADGGTLVMSYLSGIVDPNDQVRLGGYPAPFRDVLGIEVEEFAPRGDTSTVGVETGDGRTFESRDWTDVIRLTGATALATFGDDFFAGRPAVTENRHGAGAGYYIGTELDAAGLRWALGQAARSAGVEPLVSIDGRVGVEIVERSTEDDHWLFVLNYGHAPIEVPIDRVGTDVVTGQAANGTVRVGPVDVAVIRISARPDG
jgi:beta-galactosidase